MPCTIIVMLLTFLLYRKCVCSGHGKEGGGGLFTKGIGRGQRLGDREIRNLLILVVAMVR